MERVCQLYADLESRLGEVAFVARSALFHANGQVLAQCDEPLSVGRNRFAG